MARDLKLNSLSRYEKKSPDLVLEEYGHCEVPAGCGGAVLRWTNPAIGTPLNLYVLANQPFEIFLDGVKLEGTCPMVPNGEHVFAFRIANPAALRFAAIHDEQEPRDVRRTRATGKKFALLSQPDGTWRGTHDEPRDSSWMLPGFDDRSFETLVACDVLHPEGWRVARLEKLGAKEIGMPPKSAYREGAGPIWVRRTFMLDFGRT